MKSLIASQMKRSGVILTSPIQPQAGGWHVVQFAYVHDLQGTGTTFPYTFWLGSNNASPGSGDPAVLGLVLKESDNKFGVVWSGDGTGANFATGTGGFFLSNTVVTRPAWYMIDSYVAGGKVGIGINGATPDEQTGTVGRNASANLWLGAQGNSSAIWAPGLGPTYIFTRKLTRGAGSELEWLYNSGQFRTAAEVIAHPTLSNAIAGCPLYDYSTDGNPGKDQNGALDLTPNYLTDGQDSGQPWVGRGPNAFNDDPWILREIPVGYQLAATWDGSVATNFVVAGPNVPGFGLIYKIPVTPAPGVPYLIGQGNGVYRDASILQLANGTVFCARSNYNTAPNYEGDSIVIERLTGNGTVETPYVWVTHAVIRVATAINGLAGEGTVDFARCVTSSPDWVQPSPFGDGRQRIVFMFQAAGMLIADAPASNSEFFYMDSTDSTLATFGVPAKMAGTKMPSRNVSIDITGGPTGAATAATSTSLTDSAATFTANGASNFVGYSVKMNSGGAVGQVRRITAHTGTALTVTPAWGVTPSAADTYEIIARIQSVIDPFPFVQADGKFVTQGRAFAIANDLNAWIGAVTFLSTTSSIAGFDTAFLTFGFGRTPNIAVEGLFLKSNTDGSITLAGDKIFGLGWNKTTAGVGNITSSTFVGATSRAVYPPPGETSLNHFTPFVLTTALGVGEGAATVPQLISAVIAANGTTVTLTFSTSITGSTGFAFLAGGGTIPLPGVVSGSGTTRTVTFSRTIYQGEIIFVTYRQSASSDVVATVGGLPLATIAPGLRATNNSTQNPAGYWAIRSVTGKNFRRGGVQFEPDRLRIINAPSFAQVVDPDLEAFPVADQEDEVLLVPRSVLNIQDLPPGS